VGFYVPYPDDLQNVPSGMFFTKTGQWSKLPDSPEAGSFVHPVGINNARLILSRGAWVYDHQDPASGWVDLNDRLVDPTPWTIDEGVTIKNNGLILCNGSAPAGLLQEQIRPLILTPVFDEADRPSPTIELSRWRAVMQILFGIVNDAPGIGLVGGIHPHRVGPGPDDPDGPRRETLASLTAGQRDVLLGLAISEIGTLLSNPAHGRAARALAESVVARASRRLGVERSSRPAAWLSGSLRVARINERFARGRARSVAAPKAR